MSVLILARDFDPTVDRMVSVLGERGVEVFRVNTAWFPTRVQVSVELRDARWCGVLTAPRGRLDLDRVRAVWYRSPEAYRMPPELSPAEAHHARVEAKYGLGGVLASLPVLWCNHPSRVADAAYKPVQSARAALAGVTVPDTLITNEADAIRKFAADVPMVTKQVGGMAVEEDGVRKNVFTRLLEDEDLTDLRGVEHTTHLFQRWVPKARECRVIVIGRHITAAAITAGSQQGYVDYRTDYDDHPRDQREDLRRGVRAALGGDPQPVGQQRRQPAPRRQRQHRRQPGARHEIGIIEPHTHRAVGMRACWQMVTPIVDLVL